MQPIQFFAARAEDGALLPGATVSVFVSGTGTRASLFSNQGASISIANPTTADGNAQVFFYTREPRIDIQISRGGYVAPPMLGIVTTDPQDVLTVAIAAASEAQGYRDEARSSARLYSNTEEGMLVTPEGHYFSTPSPNPNELSIWYQNVGGVAVEVDRTYNAAAVREVTQMVQGFASADPEVELFSVVDDDQRAVLSKITNRRLETPSFDVVSSAGASRIGDDEGGVDFYTDGQLTLLGSLELWDTELPGLYVVDLDRAVLNPLSEPIGESGLLPDMSEPFEGGLLFTPLIVTGDSTDSFIHVESLLPKRELAHNVSATLASTTTSSVSRGMVLSVSQPRFGAQAVLNLRPVSSPNNRRFMTLNLKHVPKQTAAPVIRILMIGDSITNYGGAFLLKQYLEALGFVPEFIGTMMGAGPNESSTGIGGPLGEGRHGWQARDYTYALNRKEVVSVGGEAEYLSMAKSGQLGMNPFLRAAQSWDSDSIKRNGYVFDPAFYQSRFGLATPDIVVSAMGTNDALNIPSNEIYASTVDADRIMHSQILAAWPSVKILRTLPGTALDAGRNALWTSTYTGLIAGLQKSAKDLGSRITVAPLWAMTSPEAGYGVPTNSPGEDGFTAGNWSDDIHPVGASRHGYYEAMAPYVAAQKLNII